LDSRMNGRHVSKRDIPSSYIGKGAGCQRARIINICAS
jgi:hypothetical protein